MGIKGLHGLLKSIQKPCNLKKFEGQTLGVDAYGWLHRGTAACATDLALDRPTKRHIDFVLNRVRMLLFFGVSPYLVFDGGDLPSKSGTEADRLKRREDSKKLGLELQSKGRVADAHQEFLKAVDVTPEMARQLIEELRRMKVQYIVAPYEADAQLVYLEQQGIINGIISEDSDLLVFGARRLLSKLDQHGDCIEINRGDFPACKDISLIGWTDADFRQMCILSGCDYLPNIPKIGLKTAYRSMRKYKSVDKVLKIFQFEGHHQIPSNYLENFRQAENTFLYQRVFCPTSQKLVTLTTPDSSLNLDDMPYIGGHVDPKIAIGVASGDLHPVTKEYIKIKPSFAANPMPSLMRRQTLATSAELKHNKPINSFFTPKRVPLAELDPNSLTPSPTQQRLLERHANNSWQANPTSTSFGLTRSASSASLNGRTTTFQSNERKSFLAQAAKISTSPAVKRQRLCSDADDALPKPPEQARSRFFANSNKQPNADDENFSRTKKSRRSTFGVFSDELAEDIMCQLSSQTPESISSTEKLNSQNSTEMSCSLHTTSTPSKLPVSSVNCSSKQSFSHVKPDNHVKKESESVHNNTESDNQRVSSDENPELFEQILEAHVKKQNESLLSKFVFHGSPESPIIGSIPVANTPSSRAFENRPPTGITGKGLNQGGPFRRRLTPLQRLGQSALSKPGSMDSFFTQRMMAGAAGDSGYESDLGRDGATELSLKTDNHEGSEDQIVPTSDEDGEDSCLDSERPSSFNLTRFCFTPK